MLNKTMVNVSAHMRDWLIMAGSDELFEHYCEYTAPEVFKAIDDMYPGGCSGWLFDQ